MAFFKHVETNIFQDIMLHHIGLKSRTNFIDNLDDQITQESTLYPQIARCRGKRCQIRQRFRPKPRSKLRPKPRPKPILKPKIKPKLKPRPIKPKIVPRKPILTTPKPSERQSINELDR